MSTIITFHIIHARNPLTTTHRHLTILSKDLWINLGLEITLVIQSYYEIHTVMRIINLNIESPHMTKLIHITGQPSFKQLTHSYEPPSILTTRIILHLCDFIILIESRYLFLDESLINAYLINLNTIFLFQKILYLDHIFIFHISYYT